MEGYIFLAAQILSIFAIVLSLIGDAVKETKKIYFYNGASNAISSIKYFLLGGYTGAISCVIATGRNIVFNRFKGKVPFYVMAIYLIIAIGTQFYTVQSFIDILPIFNICFYAICLGTNNERIIKLSGILLCITGVFYDLAFKAYISVLYDCVSFVVGSCAYYIYFIKDEKKEDIKGAVKA